MRKGIVKYNNEIAGILTEEADGSIKVLQMSLKNNPQLGRLIHYSDRGSQYCCADYV
jgi:hypothetical protein